MQIFKIQNFKSSPALPACPAHASQPAVALSNTPLRIFAHVPYRDLGHQKAYSTSFCGANTIVKDISPKVKLISDTSNIIDTLYTVCKNCTIADEPAKIYENLSNVAKEEKLRVIKNAVKSGHTSVLEHAMVTFTVSDISRVCAQMLKAYRHSSTTQKSQRFVAAKEEFNYIIPSAISKNPELKAKYTKLMSDASDLYLEFVNSGIHPQDARYAYPLSVTTSTVSSFNLRELILVEGERLCSRAQEEIRVLTNTIRKELVEKEPWLKEFLMPKCELQGFCREAKSCGRKPKL